MITVLFSLSADTKPREQFKWIIPKLRIANKSLPKTKQITWETGSSHHTCKYRETVDIMPVVVPVK